VNEFINIASLFGHGCYGNRKAQHISAKEQRDAGDIEQQAGRLGSIFQANQWTELFAPGGEFF
jgi:hypothetical protein